MSLSVEAVTGSALQDVLPYLARLRITVFRDWPYLYDGSEEYEREYLAKFIAADGAVCIVARDGETIVGASTASPMAETDEEFIEPFKTDGYDIAKVFYCGESVLIGDYRGQGVGHKFFESHLDICHCVIRKRCLVSPGYPGLPSESKIDYSLIT